jgi:hypothetical protein
MANVKFVQIGDEHISKESYIVKRDAALQSYPGAIIFGTYADPMKSDGFSQEIWANGRMYSVGGGNDAHFYDSSLSPELYFSQHPEIKPIHGDYYIKTISQDVSTDIYGEVNINEKTAYVYDSHIQVGGQMVGGWVALDGNVTADNVYFPNGIRHNQLWGAEPAITTSRVDCKGYNLTQVMKHFLLVSGDVPTPSTDDHKGSDPAVTVSSSDAVSFKLYKDASGNTQYTSGDWVEVGTKLYIPKDSSVKFSGYKLTLTSEDTSVKEGGAEIYNMSNGYWTSLADASSGDPSKLAKDGSIVLTSKTGNSVYASVIHDASQDGSCSFALSTNKITYTTPSGVNDSVSTNKPSTYTELYLDTSVQRVFTVTDVNDATVKMTGKNFGTWSATRSSYTIPAVGPVWISNNEYDKFSSYTYTPTQVSSKTLTGKAATGSNASKDTSVVITVKGYYPIYSNKNATTYVDGSVLLINNTTKNSYIWPSSTGTFTMNFGSNGVGNTPYCPFTLKYPTLKRLVLHVDGTNYAIPKNTTTVPDNLSGTFDFSWNDETVGGQSVKYTTIKFKPSFTKTAPFRITLNEN